MLADFLLTNTAFPQHFVMVQNGTNVYIGFGG